MKSFENLSSKLNETFTSKCTLLKEGKSYLRGVGNVK